MKYRALAVDVDGTLEKDKEGIAPQTLQALRELQQRGIPVIVATGRGSFSSEPGLLGGFEPDYRVCVNGACVLDRKARVLYERRMDPSEVYGLLELARREDIRLCFSFEDAYYFYTGYDEVEAFYRQREGEPPAYMRDGSDFSRHAQSLPYGAYAVLPSRRAERLRLPLPGLKAMQSSPGSFDICHESNDKAVGLAHLLEQLGIAWDELVAIGDSENDLGMLQAAGMGVAMGNAQEHIKSSADYVTADVGQDGVGQAIRKFFPRN